MSLPLGDRLAVGGMECAMTIARPIIDPLKAMYKNPKIAGIITSIVLATVIALVLCSHYVKTKPMLTFNHLVSHISDFLKNPIHAGLIGGIGGICYLLIGRELINRDKLRYGWDENNPCGGVLLGVKMHLFPKEKQLEHLEHHFSPIYMERLDEEQWPTVLSQKQKIGIIAATMLATVTVPIITPIHKHPKIAVALLISIVILFICSRYVHTQSIQNFNDFLSKTYHDTAKFLQNPTYAVLVSIIGSVAYISIGREVVNENKIDFVWDAKNFPNVWGDSKLKQLGTLWGFGDRNKLLREIEYRNDFLKKQDLFCKLLNKKWKRFEEFSAKVQNEGTFYVTRLDDHSLIIFKNLDDEIVSHKIENTDSPEDLDIIILNLTACGYHQVY